MPDLSSPPCTESTPIQLFAASTTADSDIPTGAATPRGMHAIRIITMNNTIAFCLFVSIFSPSPSQKRAFRIAKHIKKQIKGYIANFNKNQHYTKSSVLKNTD